MAFYCVNDRAQTNGDHEVHVASCHWYSVIHSKTFLGNLENCRAAVEKARTLYHKVNGCKVCSPECHITR